MNHESFGQFIQFLEATRCDDSGSAGTTLIIKEPWSEISPHRVFQQLEDALPVRKIKFDSKITFDELTLELGATLVQSISVFLLVEKAVCLELQALLHEVHFQRKLPLVDRDNEIVHYLPLPSTAKLVTFMDRHILENSRTSADITTLFNSQISV